MPRWVDEILISIMLMTSCAAKDFSGSSSQRIAKPCDASKDPKCSKPTIPANEDIIIDTPGTVIAEDAGGLCLKTSPVIDFALVMDVTGSMQSANELVHATFKDIANAMQNITIPGLGKPRQVRFGLVTYEDVLVFQAPLSANFSQTQSLINTHFMAVPGGGDPPEAGLTAAKTALEILSTGGDSVKVMVLISDTWSHDGGFDASGQRSRNTAGIMNVITQRNMALTFLYSESPKNVSGIRGTLITNAMEQWKSIRLEAASRSKRPPLGQEFDFSRLSSVDLISTIPGDVASQLRKCP